MTIPGPCHSRAAGQFPAGRPGAVGGLGREEEVAVTSTRGPAPRAAPGPGAQQWPARFPPPSASDPILVHRVTFEAPGSSAIRRIPHPGGTETRRLVIRARDQARGRPDQLDVACPGRRDTPQRASGGLRIDGVLSDAAGRQHFIERGRRDWASFFEACGDDPVIEEVARLLESSTVARRHPPHRAPPACPSPDAGLAKRYGLRWDLLVMRRGATTPRSPSSSSRWWRTPGARLRPAARLRGRSVQPRHVRGGGRAVRLHPLGLLRVAQRGPTRRRAPTRRAPAAGGRPSGRRA